MPGGTPGHEFNPPSVQPRVQAKPNAAPLPLSPSAGHRAESGSSVVDGWSAVKTFERGGASTCARCSEKAADRDVRLPVKRPGAGLIAVLCTNYGQHERRRSRTRQTRFELRALELAKRGHRCDSEVAALANGAFRAADGREFREREKNYRIQNDHVGR